MEQPAQPDTGVATSSAQIPYPFPTFQPATVVTGVPTVTGTMPGPTQLSSPFPTAPAPAPVSQLTYQQIQQLQQQQLETFWAGQMEEIEQTTEFKNNSLPLARIKKIMKADEDVRMISAEAPVIFAKACELFILELTLRSWINTEENKRRTLQKNDIAAAITRADVFDFLVDIVPRDELRDEGLGVPRADPIPYFFVSAEHQMAAGPGMVMGKHIDQTSVGAYGGQHHHLGAYMWQEPQGQSREQQQQMPGSG